MSKQGGDFVGAISLSITAAKLTSEILRKLLLDYLENSEKNTARVTTVKKLEESSPGKKLENIKISDKNIADFGNTARKYDISYALKKDSETNPPTFFVFFKNDKGSKDTMERAFREFVAQKTEKAPIISREGIADIDIKRQSHEKEKQQLAHEKEKQPEINDLPEPEPDLPEPDLPEPDFNDR